MPLELLIALVVLGISGIAAMLHLTGRSDRRVMDMSAARAAWLRHFPEDAPHQMTLAANGQAALVETARGLGVLWSFGADTVGRYVDGARLDDTRHGLRLRLPDYAAPRVLLRLTAEERPLWRQKLEAA